MGVAAQTDGLSRGVLLNKITTYRILSNYSTRCLDLFLMGVLYLEISKCQIFIYILHEIRVNTILKQHLMLFNFMFRVSLAKMCYFKYVKCRIFQYVIIWLLMRKRGGAIFGGNAVYGMRLTTLMRSWTANFRIWQALLKCTDSSGYVHVILFCYKF